MSFGTEHWSSPNGCHPDCPACAADPEVELQARDDAEPDLREALRRLVGWFKTRPDAGALAASEHLLAGCPNELAVDIERARKALGDDTGGAR